MEEGCMRTLGAFSSCSLPVLPRVPSLQAAEPHCSGGVVQVSLGRRDGSNPGPLVTELSLQQIKSRAIGDASLFPEVGMGPEGPPL